jgi:hypothetical protein
VSGTIWSGRPGAFRSVSFSLVLLTFLCPEVAISAGQECMASYYRTKSPTCIDGILVEFRQAPRAGFDSNTLIGFLAELFRSSPQERDRILSAEPSDYFKSVHLVSLYRAGLSDEAEKFAMQNNLSALVDKVRATHLPALEAVRPSSTPADNDLLIGAYMASGDTAFIQRVLENYSSADDGVVSDGLRIGFMLSKFGPGLTMKGRDAVMAQTACDKYQCRSDATKLRRVMTLGTALWSLQSLSQQDNGIKKTLSDFFANDTRLKRLFAIEQNAFANYLTAIIGLTAFKDSPAGNLGPGYEALRKSAEIYEKLGSANDAFPPTRDFKK